MTCNKLSDEKLYQTLKEKFPGTIFTPVTEKSRSIAIQLLELFEQKEGGNSFDDSCLS